MIYENLFVQECKLDGYQPPRTICTAVEAEGCFCASEPAAIKQENNSIVVEEYSSIDNEVTFN